MKRSRHALIYRSRRHLAATLFFVAVPPAFLLMFSRVAQVAARPLFADFLVSVLRLAAAYGIAAILGWAMAAAFYRGRRAAVALPVFDVLQSFPTYAILPIATVLFGPSNRMIVFFLTLTIIWPVFFSVVTQLRLVRRDWEEAVAISGLSGIAYIRLFLLPASMPGLITGSIVGLGDGWEALVATEIIVHTRTGLGSFFQSYASHTTITAFGTLGLLILIFSINKLIWLPLMERSRILYEE
jgi:ABC-type nitrate/sulfonate/bicarbonate transport system permease component